MIRNPAVAGQFYPGSMRGLRDEVEGLVEPSAPKADAVAAVCPHAGYMYSGKVAGAVYSRMRMPDTFVILGPDHHGLGAEFTIMTDGVWRTPLGDVRVDSLLAREVFKRSRYLEEDPFAQAKEHSLEVQLPFMQYFSDSVQVVPICLRHYEPDLSFLAICGEIGSAIAAAISGVKSRVTIVASTDFTHYEERSVAETKDRAAIDAILALDEKMLFRQVRERNISMCGYAAVAAALTASKALGARKAELVAYMTSGDATGDNSQVVGYGGAIITR
jgi:MEMO1 family protein